MQEEATIAHSIITNEEILSLNHLINLTYASRSTQEVKGANRQLNQIL